MMLCRLHFCLAGATAVARGPLATVWTGAGDDDSAGATATPVAFVKLAGIGAGAVGRPHDWQNLTSSGRFFPHWPQNIQFSPCSVCKSSSTPDPPPSAIWVAGNQSHAWQRLP